VQPAAASEGRLETATKQFDQVAELDIANGDSEAAAIALAVSAEINSEMGRASIARKGVREPGFVGLGLEDRLALGELEKDREFCFSSETLSALERVARAQGYGRILRDAAEKN